jgi:vanillate O-demethylase monooxygenase subunit
VKTGIEETSMFLKNEWYMAAWSADVGDKPMARKIGGEDVVMFRDAGGKAAILQDRCCHRGVALSLGTVTAEGVQCGYHGMVFGANGQCVKIPGHDRIPGKARVRSFAVVEKNCIVWMWLGDPAAADPSSIVEYPFHDDTVRWPHREGMVHMQCGYEMLIDNIMDLTHIAYVHAKYIGGTPEAHSNAIMKTERTPRGVKFSRWLLDSIPPPTYAKAIRFPGRIDRWQEEELIIPCSIVQYTGGVDVAEGAHGGGSRDGGFGLRVWHGIVPETATSCHYFYSVANGFGQTDPANTDFVFNQVAALVLEDKVICESQQAIALAHPEERYLDIKSDEARVIYRRHLAQRLAQEREASIGVPQEAPAVAISS